VKTVGRGNRRGSQLKRHQGEEDEMKMLPEERATRLRVNMLQIRLQFSLKGVRNGMQERTREARRGGGEILAHGGGGNHGHGCF